MDIPRRNRKIRDLRGQKFNRLCVQQYAGSKCGNSYWVCVCECGETTTVMGGKLISGHTKSCGCLSREQIARRNFKHGATVRGAQKREFFVWAAMIQRCYNPNNKSYYLYGKRGIKICKRWKNSFSEFWNDIGDIPKGLSLDRIDPNGHYEPSNIRLATAAQQRANRRPKEEW